MNKAVSPGSSSASYTCCKCGLVIEESHLLFASEKYWHEDCLRCVCCEVRLAELDKVFYTKANMAFCKQDYLRLYGQIGQCVVCRKRILAFEFVMRIGEYVYHLNCFCCHKCQMRFCVGDKIYIRDNLVLCENHCLLAAAPTDILDQGSIGVQKRMDSTVESISPWNMVHGGPVLVSQDISAKRLKRPSTSASYVFQRQTNFQFLSEKREKLPFKSPATEPLIHLGNINREDVHGEFAEFSSEDNSSGYGSPNSLINVYPDSSAIDLNNDRYTRPQDLYDR